jgi:hypothetical protein
MNGVVEADETWEGGLNELDSPYSSFSPLRWLVVGPHLPPPTEAYGRRHSGAPHAHAAVAALQRRIVTFVPRGTQLKSSATSAFRIRTQPWDTERPTVSGSSVPWMP